MTIKAKIIKTLDKIPPSFQEELLHYAEYLESKHGLDKNENVTKNSGDRVLGQDEGLFTVPDDFNDPFFT